MEGIDNENQQLLAIKQFIGKNIRVIVVIVAAVVILVFGGNYWKKQRQVSFAAASQMYQEMALAEMQQDLTTAKSKGEILIGDYDNTPYASMASLLLAKIAVSENDLDTAAAKLRWVINHGGTNPATHLATARLAAVLQQQNKLDEALALVAKDPDPAYVTLYAQARGDIYAAKGDTAQARQAYLLAIKSLPQGTQAPLLQMKLLDLGGGESNA